MTIAWPSLLLALFAAGSLILGAALPVLRTRFFEQRLSLLIGFSAGLMLATALHELIPESLEQSHRLSMWGVSLGFLGLYVAERLTHFHACRHRQCESDDLTFSSVEGSLENTDWALKESQAHEQNESHGNGHSHAHVHNHVHHHNGPAVATAPDVRSKPYRPPNIHHSHAHTDTMALVGMSLHNFSDGLTTAAAFTVSQQVGIIVVLAIILHQTAAGLSLGAIMVRAGRQRRRVLISTALVASFILWGALFYHVAAVGDNMKGLILGIAGGSFLYVAACDLLPEAHAADEGWNVTAMTLVGYGFALLFIQQHGH